MKLQLSEKQKKLFIESIVWKQIVSYFLDTKNIDVTQKLASIQVRAKKVIIKVQGSALRQELQLHEMQIRHKLISYFESIEEKIEDYVLVYR